MERRRPARLDLADPMTKAVRRRDKPRERWLLTRKTWKYMSDAGRRLIPEGVQNRPDDVPRIEAYFQEVCQREPRFLLWRKSSYPGVLPRPRRKKRPRGGSVRARSPSDDAPPPPVRPTELFIPHTSGGRFDIAKLRRDFFAAPPPSPSSSSLPSSSFNTAIKNSSPCSVPAEDDDGVLVDLLRKYLKIDDEKVATKLSESEELLQALRNYLKRQSERGPSDSDGDPAQRILYENLGRYYHRSSNRDNTVQDLLNDRNLLKKLYHDLRKTKPYRGGRSGGGNSGGSSGGFGPSVGVGATNSRSVFRSRGFGSSKFTDEDNYSYQTPPMSPPPLIEVYGESSEEIGIDVGTQTNPIPDEVLLELERVYKEKLEAATVPTSPTSPPPERRPRRRSSVDHDDVSQSVSDTIKRYLRMARKKSVDADKTDRFKRINYDKNLRNIKPRQPGEVDDDGPHKGCQTEDSWILNYKDLQFASVVSTPTSPPSPSQSHSFLSSLLGRTATPVASPTGGMQKSRSSSSVVQSVSKRLWRTRSRSSSRVAAAWTPQGSCCWTDGGGRCVRLADTSLLTLTEVERRALQQAALARLQQLNLGTTIKIPEDNAAAVATKPKRRAYLLKRKALTTGFFDQSRAKDGDKEKESTGSVFGMPLSQCVETERALRKHGGSRASLASLGALEKGDDSESCDSGEWGWSGLEEGGGGPRVPAIVTACLAHLRRHGLRTLGLFRVSSSKKRVRQLREEWERGQEAALDSAVCPHDVATLLKEFLRDLPDPLLCRDLYPAFLNTQKIRNRRLQWEALRLIVQLLPAAHRDTLNALLSFLSELAEHAEDDQQPGNKMDAANLATIFAPNILHRNKPNENASAEQLSERADVINVVRQLLERRAELWALPAELLHDAYLQLAHGAPAHLHALLLRRAECASECSNTNSENKRLWSRESFLHAAANTAPASRASSGAAGGAPDSNDSNSDYNEGCNISEDECVITASLHIPMVRTRRRSSSSSSALRDSAVGSSAASPSPADSSSPPATPPRPLRDRSGRHSDERQIDRQIVKHVDVDKQIDRLTGRHVDIERQIDRQIVRHVDVDRQTGRHVDVDRQIDRQIERLAERHVDRQVERHPDIDRLVAFGRERNTSDARAVVVRQHDETSVSTRTATRHVRREETRETKETREIKEKETKEKQGVTLYKRNELISSARAPP